MVFLLRQGWRVTGHRGAGDRTLPSTPFRSSGRAASSERDQPPRLFLPESSGLFRSLQAAVLRASRELRRSILDVTPTAWPDDRTDHVDRSASHFSQLTL